jgi:phage head maturation protease
MMIHDASATDDGNAAEKAKMSTWLDRQSDNIADMYRRRAGGTAGDWRELMLAETWMFGDEAVEMDLADRLFERPAPAADEVMERTFDLAKFGYRYAGRRAAPAPGQRRRRVTAQVGVRQHSEEPPPPAGTRQRHTTSLELRAAARARAAGAQQAGYRLQQHRGTSTPPAGRARSLPFPSKLRATLETRRGQEVYHLAGQASVFNVRYEMWDEFGPYWEKVNQHAGDVTLAADPDVAFLINHRGVTMARTTNGSLELAASTGLDFDAWLNPKRQDVSDLVIAVEDENITETSFAFMLDDGFWNADFTEFEIMQFDINRGDVSAVNYGANPYTSITARQREVLGELERMSPSLGRAAISRLMQRHDLNLDDLFEGVAQARDVGAPAAVHSVTATERQRTGRSIANIEAMLLD